MRFRIVFLRGVYPPFNQLNNNFLPVLGHFWASLVFLFTCVAVSPLHYMYNVIRAKRLNPFTGAVFGSVCPTYRDWETKDRKSTRLNSSHEIPSRMPSSA